MEIHPWIDTIKKLSNVKRFSQTTLAKPENVLEHSGMVAAICLDIGTGLLEIEKEVDLGYLLTKAIVHDVEESELGDIAKPSKYSSDEVRQLIGELEHDIAEEIIPSRRVFGAWQLAKQEPTGLIVSFADTFSALLKFHDEIVVRGNRSMLPLLSPTAFQTLFKKYRAMEHEFGVCVILSEYEDACLKIKSEIELEM